MLSLLDKLFNFLYEDDPVYNCDVHKDIGCSHVDGMFCDMKNCIILKDYLKDKENNFGT